MNITIDARTYLAAHAPEPELWFKPDMPPRPTPPPHDPVGNDGQAATETEYLECLAWRRDPCFDLADTLPHFSRWERSVRDFWQADRAWLTAQQRATRLQWPWYWADRMLEAASKKLWCSKPVADDAMPDVAVSGRAPAP